MSKLQRSINKSVSAAFAYVAENGTPDEVIEVLSDKNPRRLMKKIMNRKNGGFEPYPNLRYVRDGQTIKVDAVSIQCK